MTYIIKREKFKTELGKKVYDRLVAILDDDNFIMGVLCEIMGDEKKKEFLEYLDKTGETDPEKIEDYVNAHHYNET